MIWLIIVFATIWVGYEAIPIFKINNLSFFTRLAGGWFLGSFGTSVILYFTSFIIPINFFHCLLFCFGLCMTGIFLHQKKKSHFIPLKFQTNPWFFVYIFFITGISLKYLSSIYESAPNYAPDNIKLYLDSELSFIFSLRKGCNRRRSHPFIFSDPRISGYNYNGYSLPLLYTTLLMSGGATYSDSSIIICFLNIITASYAIYFISKEYTKYPILSSFIFLFQGSWAPFRYLQSKSRMFLKNDLVHSITNDFKTIFYQPFAQFLSLSKVSSFSFAMAQYSILFKNSILGGIFALFIPSSAVTFALFTYFFSLPNGFKNAKFLFLGIISISLEI